eukprot:485683-Pyramimonas_sp.AAC.1
MAATRACMNAVVCQAAPAVSTKATRVSVTRPAKCTRGLKCVLHPSALSSPHPARSARESHHSNTVVKTPGAERDFRLGP